MLDFLNWDEFELNFHLALRTLFHKKINTQSFLQCICVTGGN